MCDMTSDKIRIASSVQECCVYTETKDGREGNSSLSIANKKYLCWTNF